MNPLIKKHECLIQVLALIDLAKKKQINLREHKDKYYHWFPKLWNESLHNIEILDMAIVRLETRYNNEVKKLIA